MKQALIPLALALTCITAGIPAAPTSSRQDEVSGGTRQVMPRRTGGKWTALATKALFCPVPVAGVVLQLSDGREITTDESGFVTFDSVDEALELTVKRDQGWTVAYGPVAVAARFVGHHVIGLSPIAGDFSGRLLPLRGSSPQLESAELVLFDAMSSRRQPLAASVRLQPPGPGETSWSFRVQDVPEGWFELIPTALAGQRWVPTNLFISGPAAGLEFESYPLDRFAPVDFSVVDALSGDSIGDFSIHVTEPYASDDGTISVRMSTLDPAFVRLDTEINWTLTARGYAPAFGSERDFRLDASKRRKLHVELEAGWARRLVAYGHGQPPELLKNVTVVIDRTTVGRTDKRGELVVHRLRKPYDVWARTEGWKFIDKRVPLEIRTLAHERGHVTPLMFERRE